MQVRALFFLLIGIGIFTAQEASAFFVDAGGFYFSDTTSAAGITTTSNRTFYAASLGFNIDKKGRLQVGWNYESHGTSDATGSATTTYSSSEMGPLIYFYLEKDRNWRIGGAYNLVSSASYKSGSNPTELWRGTTYRGEIAYLIRFSESMSAYVAVDYSSAAYSEKLINGTNYYQQTNARSFIYPALGFNLDL